jgi:penicillin-binding protein 2
MLSKLKSKFQKKNDSQSGEIEPDEIFLDSTNLPKFDTHQFEGRIEKPITKRTFVLVGIIFSLIGSVYLWKVWSLQVQGGEQYAQRSENNRLHHFIIFADRGIIYDKNGTELAWNERSEENDFSHRTYADMDGIAHVVGYVGSPLQDASGIYYQEEFIGKEGAEKFFESSLEGKNGLKIVETDALLNVQSESVIRLPRNGGSVTLSIDAGVQNALFGFIEDISHEHSFSGGAGVIMNVETGEMLALTSYPEFRPQILADGVEEVLLQEYANDSRKPHLNRAVSGLYTPGSIIKPFIAVGALEMNIINPDKKILSTGAISIPNPYFPDKFSMFTDWKAHGLVDMRRAIAVSSNVYFYEIGGGYRDQRGLGISNIEKYVRLFGFGQESGIYKNYSASAEPIGTIPNPEWKKENFEDSIWRIGDTYSTSIGQYGFQITPLQAVRAVSAIANNGRLLTPTLRKGATAESKEVNIGKENLQIVREGMRLAVTDGISQMLYFPSLHIAAKSGTAELGTSKTLVNSWITGFFPYETPRYAFAIIMERGPYGNLIGASHVAEEFFEWMITNAPEYLLF